MKTNLLLTAALSLSLCVASTAQTLPAYLPTDGLVGWWPFNGNANDESGNGNNGNAQNIIYNFNRFNEPNSSAEFGGVSNRKILIENPIGTTGLIKTFSVWFKFPISYPAGNYYNLIIAAKGPILNYDSTSYQSEGDCYTGIHGSLAPYPALGWTNKVNNFGNAPLNDSLVNDDVWHHLVVEVNCVNFKITEYFDGVFVGDQTFDYYPIGISDWTKLAFGNNPNNCPECIFSGLLDDIAIYNRALTPEEITALYTGEPVNPPTACNPLPANLQNGLVGYWPFCGNANDESSNGNNGTVNGATLTEDRFGVANAAYSFDGVDDYINLTDSNLLNDFSIGVWLNPNGQGSRHSFISKFTNDEPFPNGWEAVIDYNTSIGEVTFGNGLEGTYSTSVVNGIWTFFCFIYNSVNQKITTYKDGVNIHSDIPFTINPSQVPIKLGTRSNNPTTFFYYDGSLDDIGIWNRALTPDEVQQLYTLNACTFSIYDTVTVTETIYDTVSVSVSTTDTLTINTLITAVEPAQENTFLVYPNPASSQITINNGNVAILGGYTMRISNSLGQDVYNQNITQPEVTLDLSTWGGNGLYVLYIVDPQQNIVAVKQIVLQ